jgi:hypothetical protein
LECCTTTTVSAPGEHYVAITIDALPSGSYVALSHFLDAEKEYTELVRKLERGFGTGRSRLGLVRWLVVRRPV